MAALWAAAIVQNECHALLCRSINGVDGVDSDASDPVEVGQPGILGKPVVQSGLTGFAVSFSPGEERAGLYRLPPPSQGAGQSCLVLPQATPQP